MEEYDAEALDQGAVNGPIEIEVFSAMSGSLHCKIQWPETGLRQSTDFLDLTHRLPQGVPCKVTFLADDQLLSEGRSWMQLGEPRRLVMAMQSYTRDLDEELFLAVADGDIQQVNRILKKFQDPNCQNQDGATPLFKACEAGHTEVVSFLLEHRADCEADGWSPLMVAVERALQAAGPSSPGTKVPCRLRSCAVTW